MFRIGLPSPRGVGCREYLVVPTVAVGLGLAGKNDVPIHIQA